MTKGFQNNLGLHRLVCAACNQHFGNSIDLSFARSGAQGLLRFDFGMKALSALHQFDMRNTSQATQHSDPLLNGALAKHVVVEGKREYEFTPHIAIKQTDGSFVRLTIDQLESLDEVINSPSATPEFGVVGHSEALIDAFNKKLGELGRSWEFDRPAPIVDELPVFAEHTIQESEARAICKIGFNYLAKTTEETAPHLIFFHWFDSARSFIRYGTADDDYPQIGFVQAAAIPYVGDIALRNCHFVGIDLLSLHTDRYALCSIISLFQRVVFITFLSWDYKGPRDISSAHCWNFDTRSVALIKNPNLQDFIEYAVAELLEEDSEHDVWIPKT